MSVNRDQLNKALEILRKKDPQNATLQKFDEYLRSFSGNSNTTPYGSIKLWDNWDKNVNSANEEKRLMSSSGKKMVQNLDGTWQSAGYDKAIAKQKAAHDAVMKGLADPSTDPVNMDIYNAAQKKLKADQEAMAKKNQKPKQGHEPTDWWHQNVMNPINDALGSAYDHTIGNVLNYMAGGGADALSAGQLGKHINDESAKKALGPGLQKFASDVTHPETKTQKVANVLGDLYATTPAFMGIGKVVDPLAKLATANKYGQAAIRGGLAMGAYSGAKNAVDEAINPNDANLKQRLTDVGLNTAFGAALDPALVALGPIAQRVIGKLANGKTIAQVAKEEGVPEKSIADLYDYSNRQFQTESSGQVIDANAPRLNAPTPEEAKLLNGPTQDTPQLGNSPLGLNEPIVKRTFNTGKDVNVKGTPKLNAPENLGQIENDLKKVYDQRKAEEDAFVQEQMAPHIETQKRQAEGQAAWEHVVKTAKSEIDRIKGTYGKIHVPKGDRQDFNVPPQFRASLGDKHADDIHSFATQEGFATVDDAVQYLRQLDADSKLKMKDLMGNGKPMSEDAFTQLENAAREAYRKSGKGQALDNLFSSLMKTYDETASSLANNGAPLSFKKEKGFVAKKEPVNYVGQMNPKDQVTTRAEGSYSTRQADSPTGDTLKMNVDRPNPEQPLQFKTQTEQQGMKQTIKQERTRKDITEVDGRKQNVNNSQAKPETSSNLNPMGIVAGGAHTADDITGIANKQTLKDAIESGDVSFKKAWKYLKTHISSDLQFAKDMMRDVMKQDMGRTLETVAPGIKDATTMNNLWKGLDRVRQSVSAAVESFKGDYAPIIKELKAKGISRRDANEYFANVHFNDILKNNHQVEVRKGEIADKLTRIEEAIKNTKDKETIVKLKKMEGKLLKEKKDLVQYELPEGVTPESVQRVLDRWKDTPAMKDAQKSFVEAQRKDLQMQVDEGILTQAEMDAMIKKHPNYIYMGRADHEMRPGTGGNPSRPYDFIKSRKTGSKAELKMTPLESAMRNRVMTYHNVYKNQAMKTIEKIAKAEGGDKYFIQELNPHTASSSQLDNSVGFYRDGKKVQYEVPPALKQAFDNLNTTQAKDLASQAMRAVNNTIKKGATYYNVDFLFTAPIRETNALITSRTGMHPGQLVLGYLDSFLGKNLEKWSGGMFKSYKDLYEQMGGHYNGFATTKPQEVEKFMKDLTKGKVAKGFKYLDPSTLGNSLEHGQFLAEFRSAKGKGYNNLDAMHEAKNIMNYGDLGTTARAINEKVPFFGPSIVGTRRYIQAAMENPGKWAGKNLMYITLPTVGIYMMRFAPWATDEQRSKINNMADFKKNVTWAIPAPNGKDVWLIPKMHLGAQLFANPVERVLDQVFQQNPQSTGKLLKNTGKDVVVNGLMPPSAIAGVQLISDMTANYNRLLGMPIESTQMQKNPDKTQHFDSYTSEVAKLLGQNGLTQLTGQSPAKLDYLLKGLTAGTGRDVLDLIDNLTASATGNRPAKTQTNWDIINPVNRYKLDNSAGLGTYNRLAQLSKQNEWDRAQLRAATGESKLPKNEINKINDAYNELNKQIAGIRESTKYSAGEKKQMITQLRDQQRKIGDMLINSGMLRNY